MNRGLLPSTDPPCEPVGAAASVVLCVDDEPHILLALRRALRAPDLRVLCADSGEQALAMLAVEDVALIVSDMRMPGMAGTQLLEQVQLRHPDTVRVMLTGQADMAATVAAINRGGIHRYLQKPWNGDELRRVVRHGVELHELTRDRARLQRLARAQNRQLHDANALLEQRVAERTAELSTAHDALKRNHFTTIQVFSSLLDLRGGRLGAHGRRVAEQARRIAEAMALPDALTEQIFVAGLLHDIGLIGVPDATLNKPMARHNDEEAALFRAHSGLGEHALMALEDMQGVAALIRAHHERFDGDGFPDRLAGAGIPLGARILTVADLFDDLQHGHLVESVVSVSEARTLIRHARGKKFDPEVVDVFLHITEPQPPAPPTSRLLHSVALEAGLVLAADLVSARGLLMLPAGHCLSARLIDKLRSFEATDGHRLMLQVKR